MATLNPMQLMQMLKQGNPRWVAMQIVQQNYPNDPTAQNLIQMAERGDTQNLEKVVGNMLGAQGKNFSAEMQNLLNGVRNFQ
jgi:hypothetical protein